jgi:hypothetical protein
MKIKIPANLADSVLGSYDSTTTNASQPHQCWVAHMPEPAITRHHLITCAKVANNWQTVRTLADFDTFMSKYKKPIFLCCDSQKRPTILHHIKTAAPNTIWAFQGNDKACPQISIVISDDHLAPKVAFDHSLYFYQGHRELAVFDKKETSDDETHSSGSNDSTPEPRRRSSSVAARSTP